ncbi:Calx-beta domain-containing protein [Gimesia sp.]|uniref:Calx-beta domain-containing protein n=1 Tax=Gimesia sp. TaxID=2024833 RepID=UPI0032EFA1F1
MLLTNWLKSLTSRYRTVRSRRPRNQRSRARHRYQPALSRRPIGIEELEDRTLLTGYDLEGLLLPPADSDSNLREYFGSAVAISDDYLVVGSYRNGFNIGSSGLAYVYARDNQGTANDRSDDTWVFETTLSSITPDFEDRYDQSSDQFGHSVAIEGNTIVVGAPFADAYVNPKYENTGAVFVFTKDESGWKNATVTKLISPEADEAYRSSFGWSVALENNTLVVGASLVQGSPYYRGAAYVFTKNASGWENAEAVKLAASDHPLQAYFGETVAVSGDTIVIGTGDQVSAAYIYSKGIDGWNSAEEVKLTGETPSFGSSVSVRNDTVVIGEAGFSANDYTENGTVHIYQKGSSWNEYQKTTIQASTPHSGDNFGSSVFLLDDILVIGAKNHPQDGPPQGAVYIYEKGILGWTGATESFFTSSELEENSSWGSCIDFNGSEILIGSPLEDTNGVDSGAAYIFSNGINGWNSSEQKISPLTDDIIQHPGDRTGSSVAIDGDYLVVGAPYNNFRGINAGAAYIYKRNLNGTPDVYFDDFWEFETALFPSDGQDYDTFGSKVAIDGNTIVVNGYNRSHDDPNLQNGCVYIYTKQGSDWNNATETILTNSDPDFDATFGYEFDIDDNQLVVTALTAPFISNEVDYGAVYVYTNTDSNWLTATKTKIVTTNNEGYGISVGINGDSLIVGSFGKEIYGSHNGAAYIYTKGESGWSDATEFKFTPDNLTEPTRYGVSVSIDDNTAAVGASFDSTLGNRYGAAYVYSRVGDDWSDTVSTKLYADDGNTSAYYGRAVSIHDNKLVIGAIYDNSPENFGAGTAYIYENSGNGWDNSLQTKIKETSGSFAHDLAIDNETIVVGAPTDTTSHGYRSGSVHVYRLNDRSSISINNIQIIEGDSGTSSATFTVTRKGTNPGDLNQSETIEYKTFERTATAGIDYTALEGTIVFQAAPNQTTQTQTITVPIHGDQIKEIDEGFGVLLFNHVGSSLLGNTSGAATIINDDFPELIQSQSVLPPPTLNSTDHFGNDIAVDEDFMVVGAIDSDLIANNAGAAFVYRRNQQGTPYNDSDDTWDYYSTLTAFDATEGDFFGTSVAIDRETIVIGAKGDDDLGAESGSAYIFRWIGSGWVFDQKITNSDGEADDNFGTSVAIEDFTIVVGSPYHDALNLSYEDEAGAAYVFKLVGNTWIESQKLTASNKDYYDRFGTAVEINNHQIFVSGITADTGQSPFGGGAVYIFHYIADTWIERQVIGQPTSTGNIWFGINFYVDDNYLGIISPDGNSNIGGDIFIYKNVSGSRTGTWTYQQQLPTPENDPFYSFDSISISGTTLVTGSTSSNTGAAFLYRLIDNQWVESQTLLPLDGDPNDFFGYAVAFAGERVIVGAPLNNEAGTDVGKFYVFQPYVPEIFIVNDVSKIEGDSGQTIFTFTVERRGQQAGDLNFLSVVDFTTSDLSAKQGTNDYESNTGSVIFQSDPESIVQTQTISIIINGDNQVENDELFNVYLSNPSQGTILATSSARGTIENDDQAQITIDDIIINESARTASVRVSLDKPVASAINVDYTTANLSAIDTEDYLAQSGTLTFGAGQLFRTISIPLIDSDNIEADEMFLVNLLNLQNNGFNVVLADDQAEVTIKDDDQAAISIADIVVNEDAGTVEITVSQDVPASTSVSVDYATADQSALDVDDYQSQNGTLTFAPGEQTKVITLNIVDSDQIEADEIFLINLFNLQAGGANIMLADDQAEVTIRDNDQASISIDDVSVDESMGTAILTVTLTQPVSTTVTIDFTTSDQTATESTDYQAQSGLLVFPPGELTKTITVTTFDSDEVELEERLVVLLSNIQSGGTDVVFAKSQGEITIQDNDVASLTIEDITVEEDTGTVEIAVSLNQPIDTTITVDYASADQSAIAVDDYSLQTATLSFAPGELTRTISIPVVNSDLVELEKSFLVNLTNLQASGRDVILADDQAVVTISDDDQAQLTIDDISINEADGTAEVTVSLDHPVAGEISVFFETADQTAFASEDYEGQSGTITFSAGQQTRIISIPLIDTDHVEPDEQFLVNLSQLQNNGFDVLLADDQAEVTIRDDDQAQFTIDDIIVSEADGTAVLTVSLSHPVTSAVTIDYATADDSAFSPEDYQAQTGTLTFLPGVQSQSITIALINSDPIELDERFLINLSNIQAGSADVVMGDHQGEVTIQDNEQAQLIVSDLTVNEADGTAEVVVTLDQPVSFEVRVNYSLSDGKARNSLDYQSQSGTLTFAPGEQSKTITVALIDNDKVEEIEDFHVNLSGLNIQSDVVIIGRSQADVSIVDDDQAQFSITDITVDEAAGVARLYIYLTDTVYANISVDYSTIDQSAVSDSDYLGKSGRLTFTQGQTAKSITITITDDQIVEGLESFYVQLSNIQANGAQLTFASDSGEVTIEDNEEANLTMSDVTVDESAGVALVSLTLDQPVEAAVSLDFNTLDQSALANADYQPTAGTVTFQPGEVSQTVSIPLIDTDLVELTESFLVQFTNLQAGGANIALSRNQAEVTITDVDQSNITIDDISVDESAANVQVTVSLDAPVDAPVVINYATASQTAQSPSDYAHRSGSLTFTPGTQTQLISIPIVDSGLLEIDETFLVILSGLQANGHNVILADDRAVVTILDDDSASAEVNLRLVSSPTPTQPDGSIIQLPEHEAWVSEWATWWIEIWVQTNDQTSQGSISVDVDLSYNSAVASAMEIEYGPRFSTNQTGDIDDSTGTITDLHAETSTAGLQVNRRTLFARIRFTPQAQDQIDLDLSTKILPAEDLELQANSVEVQLSNAAPFVTPTEAIPAVQIYANPYDLNNDDAINFRDLILFASVYNSTPSLSDSDYAWFADLNQDDRVHFRDLLLFASNYGKSKANHSIVTYPSNFPDAWNQLLVADTSSAPQQTATPLSQTVATTSFSRIVDQVSGSLSAEQNVMLEATTVQVVDLEGDALGQVAGGTIYIDVNAAGYGWYLEGSPAADFNFVYESDLSLIALPGSDADGRFDLQTVLFHELGHLLGYEHSEDGVMQGTLAPSIRLLPDWEINFEFDQDFSLDDTDEFFLDIQDETELTPF